MSQSRTKQSFWAPLLVLSLLALLTITCGNSGSGSRSGTSSSSSFDKVGEEVRLHFGASTGEVLLAVDQKAHDELLEVMAAKDSYGLLDLLNSSRVFVVQDHTKVLVLDMSAYIAKVRVLEGPQTGRAGWVLREAVD